MKHTLDLILVSSDYSFWAYAAFAFATVGAISLIIPITILRNRLQRKKRGRRRHVEAD